MAWPWTTEFVIFQSRVEKKITPRIILAITLPILLVTLVAMALIRSEASKSAELELVKAAKSYGLVILDRLQRHAELTGFELGVRRPLLSIENDTVAIFDPEKGLKVRIDLHELVPDIKDIEGYDRCVSVGTSPCMPTIENHYSASWVLRLVGQFNTADELLIMTSQNQNEALESIGLITYLFPIFMALAGGLAGYAIVILLRGVFQPIAELRATVKKIEQGEFDHRADVQTQDEFEKLAVALNKMSTRIGGEIAFRKATSQIDESILSDKPVVQLLSLICGFCIEHCATSTAVIVFRSEGGEFEFLKHRGQHSRSGTMLLSARDQVPVVPGCHDSFGISRDGEPWGWLFYEKNEQTDCRRLSELAWKASVAVTKDFHVRSLFKRANYDFLTGLLNRLAFVRELELVVSACKRQEGVGALIFLDLDQFKAINDIEGHAIGDQILCTIAERLTDCFRKNDAIARLGGDEFAIAAMDVGDRNNLLVILQRLVDTIGEPITINRFDHSVNTSIGVCLIPDDGHDAATLLQNADVAMYKAKSIRGPSYVFFNSAQQEEMQQRFIIERKLRPAIERDELEVFLQPKLELSSGTIGSCEALVRWQDAELGFVSPAEFIPIAEQAGLITGLTEGVLRKISAYLASEPGLESVAVNLSPIQLATDNFVDRFLGMLSQLEIVHSRLTIELTESALVADPQRAMEKLKALKNHGIKIALDDFGTGYSSLSLLTALPIDALKLDKSFVDRILDDTNSAMVVMKTVEMARGLKMQVVAEGVEDEEQLIALDRMGVTHIQGYFIARPQPFEDFQILLSQWGSNGAERPASKKHLAG
ncbi:MAG: EAL domain-containing protein [bacterium]